MHRSDCPLGFRIVGDCRNERRLVDAAAAFDGYSQCDSRAEVEREAYLSAFQFGDAFRKLLTMTGSTKGYGGPCWSPWLWFDIDREGDLNAAADDARKLAASLADRYKLDGDNLLLFFSGSKGFHVGLPTAIWQPEPSGQFNRLARRFAENAAERIGVVIDAGVYDKVRAFRAPNSRHPKTGLHKRRLAFNELMHLRVKAIVKMAGEPEAFDVPAGDGTARSELAATDWREAGEQLQREATARRERRRQTNGVATLNRQTVAFIRDGADQGDRHRLLFSAAANLAEFGCPAALAHALLTESGLDSGLPPSDVRRQIECGMNAARNETTPQDSPESTVATQFGPIDQCGEKRDTGDSGADKGRSCQQMTAVDTTAGVV